MVNNFSLYCVLYTRPVCTNESFFDQTETRINKRVPSPETDMELVRRLRHTGSRGNCAFLTVTDDNDVVQTAIEPERSTRTRDVRAAPRFQRC